MLFIRAFSRASRFQGRILGEHSRSLYHHRAACRDPLPALDGAASHFRDSSFKVVNPLLLGLLSFERPSARLGTWIQGCFPPHLIYKSSDELMLALLSWEFYLVLSRAFFATERFDLTLTGGKGRAFRLLSAAIALI